MFLYFIILKHNYLNNNICYYFDTCLLVEDFCFYYFARNTDFVLYLLYLNIIQEVQKSFFFF